MKIYKGAKLTQWQESVAEEIINSDALFHIINSSRQCGKSFLMKQLLLYFAINNPGWNCMYVSMTYSQTNKLYKEILKAIRNTDIIDSFNRSENSIVLTNSSEIWFKSYQNADAIRGYSNHLLIIDEAAFCKDIDWESVFRPTLAVTGKKCILCSTPRGKNFFYDMATYGQDIENTRYKYYKVTYRDNPYANIDEVNDARTKLPEKIYRAEYEAEFVDGGMSVFTGYRECIGLKLKTGSKVAGLDVGRQSDFTVLTIFNGSNVVEIGRWNCDTWDNIAKNIVLLLKKYNVEFLGVETNGIGDVFFEVLSNEIKNNRLRIKLESWTTSNQSKSQAVETLINDFNTKEISIINHNQLLIELDNFEASYSKSTRSIRYAARGNIKDDCVMSLAIANFFRHRFTGYGTYAVA